MQRCIALLAGLAALSGLASAGTVIVTAEGRHGTRPPELARDDIQVQIDNKPVPIENWAPLRGDQAGLELYVVIDDGTSADLASQFGSLKSFINAQPSNTRIGLAYLRNGAAVVVAKMTADHAQVANALRLPMAQPGISASPYMGISDLVRKWPAAEARREILLISSGIDPWSPPDPENIYLQKSIADAQRAHIVVNSIYFAEAGHLGHSFWRINWGQNYLSELGDETGGELYWQGNTSPVSIDSYLKDFQEHLENQYLLTVESPAHHDRLESLKVMTNRNNVSLLAPSRIAQ